MPEHLLFLFLALALPISLAVSSHRRRTTRPVWWSERNKIRLYYANGLFLYALAALVLLTAWWTGRPLPELGLGYGRLPYDLTAVLLLAAFVLLYLLDLYRETGTAAARTAARRAFDRLGFLPTTGRQFLHFVFLAVAAGVGEEIVYRGFLITYLGEQLGTTGWAVAGVLLLPAVSFGLGHLYQGWRAVGKIVLMAVLFGFFFLRTGTLWPLMLVHAAVDVLGGLLSWHLQRERHD